MYRFLLRPKWIVLHIVVLALVVTMINLALWQVRRLDERKSFNSEVRSHQAADPAPIDSVLAESTDARQLEWRPVTLSGTYESSGQVLIRDRSLDGQAGFNVLAPLRLDDGRFVAVVRGWVLGNTAEPPAAPSGRVELLARLRVSQVRKHSWEKADPADGVLAKMNRVDVARFDQQVDGDALTMYAEVIEAQPADEAVTAIPAPDLSDGPHLSYAVQWSLFTLAALAGWVLAVRKHVQDDKKAARKAAKKAAQLAKMAAEGEGFDAQ